MWFTLILSLPDNNHRFVFVLNYEPCKWVNNTFETLTKTDYANKNKPLIMAVSIHPFSNFFFCVYSFYDNYKKIKKYILIDLIKILSSKR